MLRPTDSALCLALEALTAFLKHEPMSPEGMQMFISKNQYHM